MSDRAAHGGSFWQEVGNDLRRLDAIVPADVLDAWFPPAPGVLRTLSSFSERLCNTSPPAQGEGLVEALAEVRGIPPQSVVLGAGSSSLIYSCLREWVKPEMTGLVLDPTYSEYPHVLQSVIGCRLKGMPLSCNDNFRVDSDDLGRAAEGVEFLALVNPNSPTGQFLPKSEMIRLVKGLPQDKVVWIDETYIEYVGREHSLEAYAAEAPNVVVCKSMSKVYALSGLRVAYLVTSPARAESMRRIQPPWVVSLPAQLAATQALREDSYYAAAYAETHVLRNKLAAELRMIPGVEVFGGNINCLLLRLRNCSARSLVQACAEQGVFIRDGQGMGSVLDDSFVRLAVRTEAENQKVVTVIADLLAVALKGHRVAL